jgi:hypothetical protein
MRHYRVMAASAVKVSFYEGNSSTLRRLRPTVYHLLRASCSTRNAAVKQLAPLWAA